MTLPTGSRLRHDLLLLAFLIAFVALARILPHAPNFTPVVAAALFAGATLHSRTLALLVPIAAMLLSDIVIGFDEWASALWSMPRCCCRR
jgi:hypothetical protein